MTDRQFECIAMIAQCKSLTGAAKQLYISQSSLSQMLSKVEESIGTQLFIRTGSEMVPTYAGRQYLKAAEEIFTIKRDLRMRLMDLNQNGVGQITIGVAPHRNYLFMPLVLSVYMRKFPNADIVLVEEDQELLEDMVLQGKVDMAFIIHPSIRKHLKYNYLFREYLMLVMPKDHPLNFALEQKVPVNLSLVRDEPFTLTREGRDIRRLCDRSFNDAHIVPNVILESHSLDFCLQMAAYGITSTMTTDFLIVEHPLRDHIRYYPVGSAYSRQMVITYRDDVYLSYMQREFISIAAEQIIKKYGGSNSASKILNKCE